MVVTTGTQGTETGEGVVPHLEDATAAGQLVDIDGPQHALCDVHASAGLEAVVDHGVRLLRQQQPQLLLLDALLPHRPRQRELLVGTQVGHVVVLRCCRRRRGSCPSPRCRTARLLLRLHSRLLHCTKGNMLSRSVCAKYAGGRSSYSPPGTSSVLNRAVALTVKRESGMMLSLPQVVADLAQQQCDDGQHKINADIAQAIRRRT